MELRDRAVALIRERYHDFGPTLAQEKLAELHDIRVSVTTVTKWMVAAGLWVPRAKRTRTYQPRNRRSCFGELVQIDGCLHHWFEDRGPRCSLLVFVDDATGRLVELRMVESESTFSYFAATRRYTPTPKADDVDRRRQRPSITFETCTGSIRCLLARAMGRGRGSYAGFEAATEVRGVGKAADVPDLGNGELSGFEESLGFGDA